MKRFLLLLLAYLLTLLLFWRVCDLLTPEQAGAASLLIAVLTLTCALALLNTTKGRTQ